MCEQGSDSIKSLEKAEELFSDAQNVRYISMVIEVKEPVQDGFD